MTTFYISSISGKDTNTGTSEAQAWSSLSKISGKFKAGDTILLERGSDFNETLNLLKVNGTEDKPITISAYGKGENPIISPDSGKGINALYANYYVLENLTVEHTGQAGIYGNYASNWLVRNVTFNDTGGGTANNNSINWWNSSNILIENSNVSNSHGDGIFMNNVSNVIVKDNEFHGVSGPNADNIQIIGHDAVISGNILVQNADTNSNKGNLVFQGNNLYVHDNYLQGGSFGMSISGSNALVEDNVVKDHTKYTWSSDIMVTDESAGDKVQNITIKDNILSGSNRNITIDGGHTPGVMTLTNLDITGNKTDNWTKAAVAINNTIVNGTYEDNTTNKAGNTVYATGSNLANFISQDNLYIPENVAQKFAVITKTITIVASGSMMEDVAPILKLMLNGVEVGHQSVTALKANGEKQTLTFTVPEFHAGDKFEISYTNDKFNLKTGEDRNLYVHSVSMDMEGIKLKSADLTGKILHMKDGSGMAFSSFGTATFTSDDVPQSVLSKPVVPLPNLEHILETDNHVILYGNENHVIGTTADQNAYASSFKNVVSGIDDLHQLLANNFG